MSWIAAIAGVVGGGLAGYAQKSQAKATAGQMLEDARVHEVNARLAQIDRDALIAQRGRELGNISIDQAEAEGTAKADLAGGGVQLGSGSAAAIDRSISERAMRERAALRDQARAETFAAQQDIQSLRNQAKMLRKGSKRVEKAGRLGALSSVLGSGVSAYQQYQGSKIRRNQARD